MIASKHQRETVSVQVTGAPDCYHSEVGSGSSKVVA